jgi:pimeloyl-ACP methyl ester carboxylesterase
LGSHELGLHEGVDLSLPGIANLVGEFCAALELQDVTLVANDTGGAVAQWAAIRHPQRIGRLHSRVQAVILAYETGVVSPGTPTEPA